MNSQLTFPSPIPLQHQHRHQHRHQHQHRHLFHHFPTHFSTRNQKPTITITTATKNNNNPWSIDNDINPNPKNTPPRKPNKKRRGKPVSRKRGRDALVSVSDAMLIEAETILQTQEPVIKPSWDTFASSVCGTWKGVAAVFSPFTAQMEPVGVGKGNEYLYDGYTLSRIEKVGGEGVSAQVRRTTNWVTLNPHGETRKHVGANGNNVLPCFESFDFRTSEVLEEDLMSMDPGLVFFEDGSYSRGPVNITVGDFDESQYFLSPTFKFEQCIVKGCHKRLRVVHTIEFNEGGSDIQITRVALYEEKWDSPTNLHDQNAMSSDHTPANLEPVSQRKRTQPSELTGSWKVFEVSATPIFSEDTAEGGLPMVYLCTETLKKRSLPDNTAYFGEEEILDMQDISILWLPGGVTTYVDVSKDGVLCIGVGWYSDEGINLVMERDYGVDGKLKEVRSKSEVKRRWTDAPSP